ncbi:MAG: cytochrome c maturation protein CcmE [Candidatus Methylomirabilales bacterium]
MRRIRPKYVIAGGIVLAALVGLVYFGVRDSVVYFYTPTELHQQRDQVRGKALRVGGMVEDGSIRWDAQALLLSFSLTDGQASIPVRHKGTAPDLFKEGSGAVVEGTWAPEGYFRSSTIMAKHSEEYKPPAHPETLESKKELFKSILDKEKR